jgi:hypothetical protein
MQGAKLREQGADVDPAVRGRVRREPPDRLRQLALGRDGLAAVGLVPRDRHVDESLKEVALLGGRSTPGQLQLLVCGEIVAAADQV